MIFVAEFSRAVLFKMVCFLNYYMYTHKNVFIKQRKICIKIVFVYIYAFVLSIDILIILTFFGRHQCAIDADKSSNLVQLANTTLFRKKV